MSTLSGKVALVTGGARGIGAAIARRLAQDGAAVVLTYGKSMGAADKVVEDIQSQGGRALAVKADAANPAAIRDSVARTRKEFGGLDILVNNASSFYPTPVGDIDEDDWNDLIGTNLKAPLFLSQAAAGALRERNGLIVNLTDIHGVRPMRRHPVYCVAKAGLIMLTKSLARELGPQVRVNAISPGPVMWPEDGIDPALRDEIISRTALKRTGSAEDVARAVLFFATAAPFVTGQILAVDGGRSIGW